MITQTEQEQMTSAFEESENIYHDFYTDVMPERTTEEIDALSIPEGLKTMMKIEAECNREKKIIVFSSPTGKFEIHGKSGMRILLRTLHAMSRVYFDGETAENLDMDEIAAL